MSRAAKHLRAIIGAAVLLVSGLASAAETACPDQLWNGIAPALTNPKLTPQTRELCYSGYATLHSGLTRTPLWAAEHLTRERVQAARALSRVNSFHADPNLPMEERAELSDYARSGFDRGHLAPSGDMGTPEAMEESFSLANMVPQNSDNNRFLWESIERVVRDDAERRGELYVISGPIFEGENLQSLKGRVLVPTRLFKAVYAPKQNAAGAYVVQNAEGSDYQIVSLAQLEQITGIDLFPSLPPAVKQAVAELPRPRPRRSRKRPQGVEGPSALPQEQLQPSAPAGDFVEDMLNAIDQFGRRP